MDGERFDGEAPPDRETVASYSGEKVAGLIRSVIDAHPDLDDYDDKLPLRVGTIRKLLGEIDRLRLDARKAYRADGSWELRETPEEVIRYRIECAQALARSSH